MKATCNGVVLAESDATVVIEGNHNFPPESLDRAYFTNSATKSTCPWKGKADYFSITVEGQTNTDAAWTHPTPKPAAKEIAGHVAFWRGVTISGGDESSVGNATRFGRLFGRRAS